MSAVEALRYDTGPCSIARTLDLIGEKWSLLVLRDVFSGVRRFDDLHRRVGAPRQVLSARLATLVDSGILRRHPYRDPGQRTRYEYRLTEAGLDLYPVLVSLLRWGDRYLDQPGGGPSVELTHRDCGEPVEIALRCRAGHELASAREVHPRPGPGAVLLADDDPRAPAQVTRGRRPGATAATPVVRSAAG
jgi:DNA-binding HxlR family transcriptional regulator